jgi:hypothetical protein
VEVVFEDNKLVSESLLRSRECGWVELGLVKEVNPGFDLKDTTLYFGRDKPYYLGCLLVFMIFLYKDQ